jgi:hypothetical protein
MKMTMDDKYRTGVKTREAVQVGGKVRLERSSEKMSVKFLMKLRR